MFLKQLIFKKTWNVFLFHLILLNRLSDSINSILYFDFQGYCYEDTDDGKYNEDKENGDEYHTVPNCSLD